MLKAKAKTNRRSTRTRAIKRANLKLVSRNGKASKKQVYFFGNGKADGDGSMKPLLGGKGANLAEMTRIGLPVPPGFTITTEVCAYYYDHKRSYPRELTTQVQTAMARIEVLMGKKFGDA